MEEITVNISCCGLPHLIPTCDNKSVFPKNKSTILRVDISDELVADI